eukprot:CAMPEP_0180070078 /NCGR_PEP_ID=MMETSP0985-20121206/11369_1 /TAXON_ID=483367 /ORGANISM="non described non described, Strain CCMP 2436" /LENGTH=64 /DNA_ID=CAMNT_0022001115 /DNA_START=143 /DNA_END=334 /DNA_ORIENTATION=+
MWRPKCARAYELAAMSGHARPVARTFDDSPAATGVGYPHDRRRPGSLPKAKRGRLRTARLRSSS